MLDATFAREDGLAEQGQENRFPLASNRVQGREKYSGPSAGQSYRFRMVKAQSSGSDSGESSSPLVSPSAADLGLRQRAGCVPRIIGSPRLRLQGTGGFLCSKNGAAASERRPIVVR